MRFAALKSLTVMVVATLSVGLSATLAHAEPIKYGFRGGSMYAISYSESGSSYFGKISKSGKVTVLSGDLGVSQVTDADYSTTTGLVYLLADGYTNHCSIWKFNPNDPDGTIAKLADVTNPSYAPASPAWCTALAIQNSSGRIMVAQENSATEADPLVGYYEYSNGAFGENDAGFDQYMDALDCENSCVSWNYMGDWIQWELIGSESGHVRRVNSGVHSFKFDGVGTPWITYTNHPQTMLGKVSDNLKRVKWGRLLKDRFGDNFPTEALVFIPLPR